LPKTWYKALLQYHAATAAARPNWPEDGKYLSLDAHSISIVTFVIIISSDHVIILSPFKDECKIIENFQDSMSSAESLLSPSYLSTGFCPCVPKVN